MPARYRPRLLLAVAGGQPAAAAALYAAQQQQAARRPAMRPPPSSSRCRAPRSRRRPTNCRSTSSSCRTASISRSMPRGIAKARSLRVGKRGTVFVGSMGDKVSAIVDTDGKRAVKVIASGLNRPSGLALPRRHALHRRAVAHLQDRQCRGRARQSAQADRDRCRSAEERAGQRALYRRRSRRQALCLDRPALQQLRAAGGRGRDPPHRTDGRKHRSGRARRAQFARLRLVAAQQDALFHRQRPRLAVGGCAERRAQPRAQAGRGFRRALLLSGRPHRSAIRLGPLLRRIHAADRAARAACRAAWACASTPAACFRGAIAAPSSSPATAPGIGPRSSAATWSCCISTRKARCSRWSRFSPAFSPTIISSAARWILRLMPDGSLLISDDWNGAVYRVTYGSGREEREEPRAPRAVTAAGVFSSTTSKLERCACAKKTGPREGPGSGICRRGGPATFQRGTCCKPVTLGGYASGQQRESTMRNASAPEQRRAPHVCHAEIAKRDAAICRAHRAYQKCQRCALATRKSRKT